MYAQRMAKRNHLIPLVIVENTGTPYFGVGGWKRRVKKNYDKTRRVHTERKSEREREKGQLGICAKNAR